MLYPLSYEGAGGLTGHLVSSVSGTPAGIFNIYEVVGCRTVLSSRPQQDSNLRLPD